MSNQLTEQELNLLIGNAVIEKGELTLTSLIESIFGQEYELPSVLRDYIRNEFIRRSKTLCRITAKTMIADNLQRGSSEFIRRFLAAETEDQLVDVFPLDLSVRLRILKEVDGLGSLMVECTRIFNKLREKLSPADSECKLRYFLNEWLHSGYMPLEIWKTLYQWKISGPTLTNLRNIKHPECAQSDANWLEFMRLLKKIKTDNFVDSVNLCGIMDIYFSAPQISVCNGTVKLIGRILYLSEWLNRIQDSMKSSEAITEVAIYAEDNVFIDCNLTDNIWQGKNLIIVTQIVNVYQEAKIRLSGGSHSPAYRKALSAPTTAYRGSDGRDGRAGESSGNLVILATKMLNPHKLTIELNGGRGEDGEDGGDGCDGKDGVGVTVEDINQIVLGYSSLYRDSWSNFNNYSPPSNWKLQSSNSSSGEYIHRKYQDEHGREITYSFAADKGWVYTTYDLYFLMRGSNGTSGTSGGSNGVGGQGGYNGTCVVRNPETEIEYQVKLIREGKNSGLSGENGKVGKSGRNGMNGNDMVLIDRSAQEASKYYEGNSNTKLSWNYLYTAETKSRLDGYKRFYEKETACFIKFQCGQTINTSETRATTAKLRATRKTSSEAVAKQSIAIGKVFAEAQSLFGKQNAFLASACKASAKASIGDENEDEDEEEEETVSEEVVILRENDDTKKLLAYTPESEKKTHSEQTPELFVSSIKSLRSHPTINKLSQLQFDLFKLEFPPPLLDSIVLNLIYYQSKYRILMRSSIAVVLVSVLQSRISNGKTLDEIKQFNTSLFRRRKLKIDLSRIRQKLQNIVKETDVTQVEPSLKLCPGDKFYFGIKKASLSSKLAPFIDTVNVKGVVKSLFAQYPSKAVSSKLLQEFYMFLTKIQPHYEQQLKLFAREENFDWCDNRAVQAYLSTLSAWLTEEILNKKKQEAKNKESEKNVDNAKSVPIDEPMRPKTALETYFISFLNAFSADLKYWNHILEPLNKLISKSKEYTERFGKITSSWFTSSHDDNIEKAKSVIKLYYLAKVILGFYRTIYMYNAMMMIEKGEFMGDFEFSDKDERFDAFHAQFKKMPLQCDSDNCEVYMIQHGLNCKPFRYLLSQHLNIKLCSYRTVSFHTLKNIETLNPTAEQCEVIWLEDGAKPQGIAPHEGIRELVAAQASVLSKYKSLLSCQLTMLDKLDFNKKENLQLFVSFFPQPLQGSVVEWVDSYMVTTKDQSFIQLLFSRMWVDGCHISLFELQSILLLFISLKQLFHCELGYLLLLANSVEQAKIIDVLLYARLQYHLKRRFSGTSKIFSSIQLIQNNRFKSLLAAKLSAYDSPIDEEDLYKICLMLQNASNGSEQLEKIGLNEWISVAQKQKWSEIGYLLQQYGSIGYYLGVLDNKGFKKEEARMRELFDTAAIIPEKMIALYTQWIITKEIDANEQFYSNLKEIFNRSLDYPGLTNKVAKYQLLTNEIEQNELIKWLQKFGVYEGIHSSEDRNVDDLVSRITGVHDSPEEVIKRKENVRKIAELLRKNDENSSLSIKWLNKFDDALFKIQKKRLRDTQKLAVLCAVESDKQKVLEQVNTGEGKSLIIAAIATIHIKSGKRYVDIITSSPVLAQRDCAEMSKTYAELGITSGHNCYEDNERRKQAYAENVVYGDIARFQRDHLLQTFYKKQIKGDRTQVAVIVDEVDNMLLDNGNSMLYLSHSVPGMDLLDSLLVFIQQHVHSPIYTGDKENIEPMKQQFDSATIKKNVLADLFGMFSFQDLNSITANAQMNETQRGAIYEMLIRADVIDSDGYLRICTHQKLELIDKALASVDASYVKLIKACFSIILDREKSIELPMYLKTFAKLHLDELIENSNRALLLEPNTGYVLDIDRTGKLTDALEPLITIIDTNTGADLATSQWSGGLHQFLQLKHGCRLSPVSLKAVFVSNVAYLKRYQYINGLSGTLGSIEESKTLIQLYDADLIRIPTNKPKLFYEHVPVIATVREQWIANIYNEVCDQVSVMRSVLLICSDIKHLEDLFSSLDNMFKADMNASENVKECFNNVTIYKREHDEFGYEDQNLFEPSRLIIATNLAGRGTDIKLSKALIEAGGLHVITAFMPKNCRIEEQAFGRAARCGQPGSGQIIALTESLNHAVQPSIFQLKMFRDNAEVHRLQSLKNFYDYHTEIEEACLQKFYNYCEEALGAIYSKSETSDDSNANDSECIPTPSQVVYFALLDQWALWLDSKSPLIKQCSLEYSQPLKETIIQSVEEFLNQHPFGSKAANCFDAAKAWLNSPQSLLTIGIIQMFHCKGFKEAEDTFNKILQDGHEFAAEVYYYKACMRMKNFEEMRKKQNSLKLTSQMSFEENIEKAIEYFYKSRTAFLQRSQRKQREASIVAQLIEKLPENNPKTSGYGSQIKSIVCHIQLILNNIDYLLGTPCHSNMFARDGISSEYSKEVHDSLCRQGLISPTLLTGSPVENWQIAPLKSKYKLHRKQIETMIKDINEDPISTCFRKLIVLDQSSLLEHCPLSTKHEFWAELEGQNAIYDSVECVAIHDHSSLSEELAGHLKQLKTFTVDNSDEIRTLLRYSSEVALGTLYKLQDVQKSIEYKPHLMSELNQLVDNQVIKLDKFGQVLIIHENMSYFSSFDGVKLDDLKDFFNIDNHSAAWILNILKVNGILSVQTVQMTRFTSDDAKWESLVRSHLKSNATKPTFSDPIELQLLYENAGILQSIKNDRKLVNVTKDVIAAYCKIPNSVSENAKETKKKNENENLNSFYEYLEKEQILESYLYNIWRLNSKLDCSSLPPCIADRIDEFLSDRFAYSFALEQICMSLENANKNPVPSPNQLFLAENPFREVYIDMINCGLAIPSCIFVLNNKIEQIDFEDYEFGDEIKSVINSNRLKLYDQTDYHMNLIPFSTYASDQGALVDSDLRNIINNGFKVVVARSKETTKSWLLNGAISVAASCWNAIKKAANSVTSFAYSAVQFICRLPVKLFNPVAEFLSPYLKQAGSLIMRIAQPLLRSKFGKAAVNSLQYLGDCIVDLTYKTVDTAEWLFDKGTEVVNYIGNKASDAVEWIGSTRIAKGAVGMVKTFGSWVASTEVFKSAVNLAMYVYTKMSNFCTAIAESYQYYNQCRTMARRLVLEKHELVDEHTILKTFHGVSQQEAKKTNKEKQMDNEIRSIIESWREPLTQSLVKQFNEKLDLLENNKYTVDFIKSYLVTNDASNALNDLQNEMQNILNFYAWKMQISCFKHIKDSIKNPARFKDKIKSMAFDGIPPKMQFFIDNAVDQLLQHLQSRSEDEGYKSSEENEAKENQLKSSVLIKSLQTDNWKRSLETIFVSLAQKEIEIVFIEKTIAVVLNYINSLRDANLPPSEAQFAFNQENKSLKQALLAYSSSNQLKQKSQFLVSELHNLIVELVGCGDINEHRKTIRNSIKYGYPLSLASAGLVVDAFDKFLKRLGIYKAGISCEIKDDVNNVVVKYVSGTGKAKLSLRHFDGLIFICQSDYRAYIGMVDKMNEEVDPVFFYESFIAFLKLKNVKDAFTRKAETLREGLLTELEVA